jgi:hypothetical protein
MPSWGRWAMGHALANLPCSSDGWNGIADRPGCLASTRQSIGLNFCEAMSAVAWSGAGGFK